MGALLALLWAVPQLPAPSSPIPAAIPMRDGTTLRATIMKPTGAGPFPVLVYRTPYGQEPAVRTYSVFEKAVRRGYAVVAEDVRGRYLSDGDFDPYRQEGKDGYDTIEWAAAQPWSTGKVGTFGLSYPGAVQWLAAIEAPPHLAAMVPAMTFSTPANFWYAGGLPDLSWLSWIWFNIAPDVRRKKGLAGPRTPAEVSASWSRQKDGMLTRLPLTDVPELRDIAPWYFEWLSHPPDDPWWKWADLTDKYGRVKAAVLNLSGWHDDNYGPEGAITNFQGLVAARSPAASLVIGPWVHGVSGINDKSEHAKSGERVFGLNAGLDYDAEILRFMDRYLLGVDSGAPPPAVRVFVMGENVWRTADRWPLPGTTRTPLFLDGTPAGRGKLGWKPARTAGNRSFTSDPTRPVADPYAGETGAHDYRALADLPNAAVFETGPLDQDLRVVGEIELTLSIETDAPDVDLWAKVLDVAPDGTAWNLMSPGLDVVRASYRNGKRALLTRGAAAIGNLFQRGHRIRLVLLPSFMPHFSRNLQTGKLETESAESRPATIRILTGADRSRLTLPVVPNP